ncbi:MAG: hypothetical protein WEE89_10145 [Gemmatimonadota bacterium]
MARSVAMTVPHRDRWLSLVRFVDALAIQVHPFEAHTVQLHAEPGPISPAMRLVMESATLASRALQRGDFGLRMAAD